MTQGKKCDMIDLMSRNSETVLNVFYRIHRHFWVGTYLYKQALLLVDDNNETQWTIEIDFQKNESWGLQTIVAKSQPQNSY